MTREFKRHARAITMTAIAATAIALPGPASAEGLFDFLFGGAPQQRRSPPPSASAYADPSSNQGEQSSAPRASSGGGSVAYCVRLCDGRFFPIQRSSGADAAQVCSSFCPAAKTKIFSGSGIDHASARDGTRYADLPNAFVHRERIVDGCTCNGKDSVGLVTTPAAEDPTLRAGDVVANGDGFVTYSGSGSKRRNAEFTPVSGELRARLANTQIVPNATPVSTTANPSPERPDRRVQLDR
jgi:hypothetical protein